MYHHCIITIAVKYGDWFLLVQIAKNIDQETFTEFLTALRDEVRTTLPRYIIDYCIISNNTYYSRITSMQSTVSDSTDSGISCCKHCYARRQTRLGPSTPN